MKWVSKPKRIFNDPFWEFLICLVLLTNGIFHISDGVSLISTPPLHEQLWQAAKILMGIVFALWGIWGIYDLFDEKMKKNKRNRES